MSDDVSIGEHLPGETIGKVADGVLVEVPFCRELGGKPWKPSIRMVGRGIETVCIPSIFP